MQTLGRLLVSQLRPHVLQGSTAVTAAAGAAAGGAAAAAGGLLTWGASSIRAFSSDAVKRIYVGNLSFESTAQDVQQAFEKFGKVHDCVLPKRPDGKHRGYGFVELDAAAADAAIQALNESELQGRPINVKEAQERGTLPQRGPRPEVFVRPGFQRLYVGNLNFRTTAADLGKHFQQYGAVQDCVIPLDSSGRSRGFGFVELDDAGAAAALKTLDGSEFDGRRLTVRPQDDKPSRY